MYFNQLPAPSCSLYSAEGVLRICALEMIVIIVIYEVDGSKSRLFY